MNICIIGTGYVGLVAGASFAEIGNVVTCVDSDAAKVGELRRGRIGIYEPGLEALVTRNFAEGRLVFSEDLAAAARHASVFFIAVGTPAADDGDLDVSQVLAAALSLGRSLAGPAVVVVKSTVPVGTTERVDAIIASELRRRGSATRVAVAFNPEFLKEGDAVNDFMRPDRVIAGSGDEHAVHVLRTLYAPLIRNHERFLVMGVRDAELTKYAANAMLATRISLMNEIAGLCEKLGADIERVRVGIGSDTRIGDDFIQPGCGYGGSCFPKDVRALIHAATRHDFDAAILKAVDHRNDLQRQLLFEKIRARFGESLGGLQIGVWGLAFKPGTDDMREASSRTLLEKLLAAGANVYAHDPAAMDTARRVLPGEWFADGRLRLAERQYDAAKGADALVLVTEWQPYRQPDFELLRQSMRSPIIFDGRNQYEPALLRASGFEYYSVGRAAVIADASTIPSVAHAR